MGYRLHRIIPEVNDHFHTHKYHIVTNVIYDKIMTKVLILATNARVGCLGGRQRRCKHKRSSRII